MVFPAGFSHGADTEYFTICTVCPTVSWRCGGLGCAQCRGLLLRIVGKSTSANRNLVSTRSVSWSPRMVLIHAHFQDFLKKKSYASGLIFPWDPLSPTPDTSTIGRELRYLPRLLNYSLVLLCSLLVEQSRTLPGFEKNMNILPTYCFLVLSRTLSCRTISKPWTCLCFPTQTFPVRGDSKGIRSLRPRLQSFLK